MKISVSKVSAKDLFIKFMLTFCNARQLSITNFAVLACGSLESLSLSVKKLDQQILSDILGNLKKQYTFTTVDMDNIRKTEIALKESSPKYRAINFMLSIVINYQMSAKEIIDLLEIEENDLNEFMTNFNAPKDNVIRNLLFMYSYDKLLQKDKDELLSYIEIL